MGTRRRFSRRWHEKVLIELNRKCRPMFSGASNILLAKKLNLNCIGTIAHEWLQAHQHLIPELVKFQKAALYNWIQGYKGKLGIALSDVIGFNAFLKDFDYELATRFIGTRHDSGDPFKWGNQLLKFYNSMGIDSNGKTAVFSDGLDFN